MRRIAIFAVALALAACDDPVHDAEVDGLGGELSGVGPGPRHRPGQPCTVCHGGKGPASPEFVVAGTVYETRGGSVPAAGVDVTVTDGNGTTRVLSTNDVGNFYLEKDRFPAQFPLRVQIARNGISKRMDTRIGRDGGCATCHQSPEDHDHADHIFLAEP